MRDFAHASQIIDVIRQHAQTRATQDALILVNDAIKAEDAVAVSYAELDLHARRIAAWLQASYVPGERVLLLYPAGLQFVISFVACIYAGMVAVPAPLPGQHQHKLRRLRRIATDAQVVAILTDAANAATVFAWMEEQKLAHIPLLAVDDIDPALTSADPELWQIPEVNRATLVLLQYTSGTTGDPKGVMVDHNNLLHNVDSLRRAYGLTERTRFGGWIPMFHDMGLMGLLLPALFLGSTCILMPPNNFLKRPFLWLKMIDRFRINFSAAPNFSYDLCLRRITDQQLTGIDLRCWEFAVNGSEPVQAATLKDFAKRFACIGFSPTSMCPCYGMAETTLFVSGTGRRIPLTIEVDEAALEQHRFRPRTGGKALVSCGRSDDFDVAIVDPETRVRLPDGEVGEIWLRGPSVTQGYWNHLDASANMYGAHLSIKDPNTTKISTEPGYFRTSDLGTIHHGEIFITGRFREVLTVQGRNLYPQDIEHELRTYHPELAEAVGAVFTVAAPCEEVVVIHEVRGIYNNDTLQGLVRGIKNTIMQQFQLRASAVLLLRTGGVLRTTSGKIQRAQMRQAFLQGQLKPLQADTDAILQAFAPTLVSSELLSIQADTASAYSFCGSSKVLQPTVEYTN